MPRYFFALWPDQEVRKKISACRSAAKFSGKLVAEKNFHITLLFMGRLRHSQLLKVTATARLIKQPGFSIQLNQNGYFKSGGINWLSLQSIPEALLTLQYSLSSAAKQSRISLEQRPYIPHLTLSRRSVHINIHSFTPIDWTIRKFVLIESTDTAHGVHYQVIKNFPLLDIDISYLRANIFKA